MVGLIQAQSDSSKKDTTKTVVRTTAQKPKPITVKPKDSIVNTTPIKDSLIVNDSLALALADSLRKDSLAKTIVVAKPIKPSKDTSTYAAIMFHKYLPIQADRLFMINQVRRTDEKDILFYALLFLVALVAFIRVAFPKYFQSLFQLFFQTSFRQKQTREQLLQDNLPSLLMNFLFILSTGMLIALLAQQYNWVTMNFWWLLLYSCSLLCVVYLVKYLFLLFSGWVFNVQSSTNTYLFIVFLTNKVLGILCIPFSLVVAFAAAKIATIAVSVIACIVIILFIYRYVASLGTIRSTLKVNALHFFLYLCTVEVMPLILMYKAFFNFIKHSTFFE